MAKTNKNLYVLLLSIVLFFSFTTNIAPRKRSFCKTHSRSHQRHNLPQQNFSKCFSVLIPKTSRGIKKNRELRTLQYVVQKGKKRSKVKSLLWHKKTHFPFTEIILSWNAPRPKKGYFSFWTRVKHSGNKKTQVWSRWSKISSWGKLSGGNQKTFCNTRRKFVHTKHVRVELQKKRIGSEFQIKVVAEDGANIKRLEALFVNASNERNFSIQKKKPRLRSIQITGIPKQSQFTLKHKRRKDLCSPTAMSMITQYFMQKNKHISKRKKLSYKIDKEAIDFSNSVRDESLDIYGNWLFNVAQAYNATKGKILYRVQRLNNFEELHKYLEKNIPIAVSIRGALKGGAWPYKNGHFVVVMGYEQKGRKSYVLCIDPAFRNKKQMIRRYSTKDFFLAWGKSRNLAYVPIIKKRNLSFQ